ncbi:MAG TPA: hypothetical protein VLC12_11965, partial [Terriglobales bacterium]|nr:hypothetical protein [Terriglobales bacterium]
MGVIELYVRLQLLLAIFMVMLLWALYVRLRHQQFFQWWAWAWTAFALFLVLRVPLLRLSPHWTSLSASLWLLMLMLGFLQSPLLVLGAWCLLPGRPPGRRAVALSLAAAIAAACLVWGLSLLWPESRAPSVATRFIPRMLCMAGALLFCTYVFARRWQSTRSWASAIIAVFCFLCASDRVGYLWIYIHRLLLGQSTPPTMESYGAVLAGNPLLYFLDITCLCAICLGMVLLVVEEHARTEHALWESNNHTREIAA